jgi:hypothetical protein
MGLVDIIKKEGNTEKALLDGLHFMFDKIERTTGELGISILSGKRLSNNDISELLSRIKMCTWLGGILLRTMQNNPLYESEALSIQIENSVQQFCEMIRGSSDEVQEAMDSLRKAREA